MSQDAPPPTPTLSRIRVAIQVSALLLLGAASVGLWTSGLLEDLDAEKVRLMVAQAGWKGPLIYLLIFGLLQPIGFAAHVLILAAAVAWPPHIALPLAWTGMMLAACTSFVLSRYLARDLIDALVPQRFRRWDERLARDGLRTMLVLRLIFFTTFFVQIMFGLTRVRWRDYLLGTALGNLPVLAFEVIFADQVLTWMAQ